MTTDSQINLYQKHLALADTVEHEIFSASNVNNSKSIKKYFSHHYSALIASCKKLWLSPLSTSMIVIVIAIALALPTSLLVLLQNVKYFSHSWSGSEQIALYLKMDVSSNQVQTLLNQIKTKPGIANVQYISPQQGLAEFQNQAAFQNDIQSLNNNPLPGVILVQPKNSLNPTAINQLVKSFQLLPQVDLTQFNMQWAKRLTAMVDLAKHLVIALGILLSMGILFIIGNTVHLALQEYQHEIEVFTLVGATHSFIRRPFLYAGILYGLIGSILAGVLVTALVWSLRAPISQLVNLYGSQFHLQGLNFTFGIYLILIGVLLGFLGARLAVGKHLRDVA